jgi:hypothetical protein
MACVTDNSPAVTSPILRLELPYPNPCGIGTVYHSTAAQRRAERAYNRGLDLERGRVAANAP